MEDETPTLAERLAAAWAPLGPMTDAARQLILRDLREMESELTTLREAVPDAH